MYIHIEEICARDRHSLGDNPSLANCPQWFTIAPLSSCLIFIFCVVFGRLRHHFKCFWVISFWVLSQLGFGQCPRSNVVCVCVCVCVTNTAVGFKISVHNNLLSVIHSNSSSWSVGVCMMSHEHANPAGCGYCLKPHTHTHTHARKFAWRPIWSVMECCRYKQWIRGLGRMVCASDAANGCGPSGTIDGPPPWKPAACGQWTIWLREPLRCHHHHHHHHHLAWAHRSLQLSRRL